MMPTCDECGSKCGVRAGTNDGAGDGARIEGIHEECGIAEDFRERAARGTHDRSAGHHRFEWWNAESFPNTRVHETLRVCVERVLFGFGNGSDAMDAIADGAVCDDASERAGGASRNTRDYQMEIPKFRNGGGTSECGNAPINIFSWLSRGEREEES